MSGGNAHGGNWRAAARCRTADAEGLFVTGARQREARRFCRTCRVRTECLAYALDQRVEFGVWGGTTERERRALLRARPDVTSWDGLLSAARDAHGAQAPAPVPLTLVGPGGSVVPVGAPGRPDAHERSVRSVRSA